jgi:hypothetical protein
MGQKFHRVDRYLREGIGALHPMLMPLSGLPTSIMYLPSLKFMGLGTAIQPGQMASVGDATKYQDD